MSLETIGLVALFVYTVSAFGLAWIVGHASISYKPRLWLAKRWPRLVELLECPGCSGFWIGTIASGAGALLFSDLVSISEGMAIGAVIPLYTAGANYILGRLTGLIRED